LFQWNFQAARGHLRFGGFEAGGFGRDRAPAVVELDVRRDFRNGFHNPKSVLRMTDIHADVQCFDFHGEILAADGHG
jgi:hypothetical protein